jgi:type II secretory pathway pseudopilin PulG
MKSSIRARKVLGDERGVTIIEALIAAVVVGIAAVGVAVMFASGQAFVSAEGDNRVAVSLAQQRVEQVRAYGYQGLIAVCLPTPTAYCPSSATPVDVPGSGSGSCVSGEPCYRRTTTVDCVNRDDYAGGSEACVSGTSAFLIRVIVQTLNDPKTRTVTLLSVLAPR